MPVNFGRVLTGVVMLLVSSQVLASADNSCPPLIPPPDQQKLAKMLVDPHTTPADLARIMAASSRVIRHPVTWSGCHRVLDKIEIQAPVTIAPGSELRFEENAGIDIEQNGSLNASGTAAQPILFTASDKTAGYWYGLYYSSNSDHNRLIHTRVLYAGGLQKGKDGSVMRRAEGDSNPPSRAVLIDKGASLRLEDTRIANSGGYGIEVLGSLRNFKNNQIIGSVIPARMQIDAVGKLDSASRFTGNQHDEIGIIGLHSLNRDATWIDPGVPYVLHYGDNIDAHLTLSPGVKLLLGETSTLVVERPQGALTAIGTPDKPITIRGMSQTPGFWSGLQVNTRSADNILQYVRVADGGGDNYYKADIYVAGHLKIAHSWVENSARYGIVVNKNSGFDARLSLANVTYHNNKSNYTEVH